MRLIEVKRVKQIDEVYRKMTSSFIKSHHIPIILKGIKNDLTNEQILEKIFSKEGRKIMPGMVQEKIELFKTNGKPKLCFIMENFANIYSGGRYLSHMVALAFQEIGFDVTLYTDVPLDKISYVHGNDFKDYKEMKMICVESLFNLSLNKNDYDVYVGAPTDGCVVAHREAMKNNKMFITFLFDVPTFMREYSQDLREDWINDPIWNRVAVTLRDAELVIVFSDVVAPYVVEFGKLKNADNIRVLSPLVNSKVADKIEVNEKKNQIFMISRFVKNKRWGDLFKAVSMMKNKPRIAILSREVIERILELAELHGVRDLIDYSSNISDENKFKTIKESKVVVAPSSYEGILMSMLEGLRCNVPVVTYDFPIMKSIAGEMGVTYADYLDVNSFKEKIELLLSNEELYDKKVEEARQISLIFGFENFVSELKECMVRSNLNVLIYNIGYKAFSGGVYYVDLLGVAIAMAGNNVTIITDKENKSESGINHHRLKRVMSSSYEPPDDNYHVVMTIHGHHMIKALEYAGKKNAMFVPIVFEIPNWVRAYGFKDEWSESSDSTRAYLKEVLPKASRILTIGHECKKYLNEWIPETNDISTYVIPAIINDKYVSDDVVVKEREEVFICFIGRNGANKRIEYLVSAVNLLGELKNKVRIKYITPVKEPMIDVLVKRLGIKMDIHISVSEKMKYDIIKQCDLLVSTATFDAGTPLPIIEAMLCKKPVIAFDIPNIRYSLGNSIDYVKSRSIEEMSNRIKMFMEDETYREMKIERAEEVYKVALKYTISEIAKSNVLNEVIQPIKIGVNLGVLNEEKFVEYAIRQYAELPFVTKVVITEAADKLYPKASKDGLSVDRTADVIRRVAEEYPDKVVFEQIGWVNGKSVYQNRGIELLEKYDLHYMFKADSDEFYTVHSLYRLRDIAMNNLNVSVILYPITTFWLEPCVHTTGGQWDSKLPRLCKFVKGMRFKEHSRFPVYGGRYMDEGEILYPDDIEFFSCETFKEYKNIMDKLKYYKTRDKKLPVTDTITNWRPGMPTQYTHGSGVVRQYKGIIPMILYSVLRRGKLCLEM